MEDALIPIAPQFKYSERFCLAYVTPRLLIDRLGSRQGTTVAALVILGIALVDYATGYSLRLSILYLVPIAVVAWVAGRAIGYGAAILSSLLWLFSFQSEHFYRNQAFFVWEASAMLCGFLAFAWLSARLRQALREADERFIRLLIQIHAAVYVADERADRIIYANPGLIEIAGDPAALTIMEFERRWQREIESHTGTESHGMAMGFSSATVRDVCTGRWYLLQEGIIPWGANSRVKLKVLTDITDQKNAERMREKNLEVMHQAAQLTILAEMASTLAHEVNQPLMVIATYTDACQRLLAASRPDLGEIAGVLGKCHAQAVRASSIIERLREFIRRRQHRPSPTDPHTLVAEALDIARPLLDEQAVRVLGPSVVPGRIVDVDRVLLVQVLTNLLRNAIDAVCGLPPERRQIAISVTSPEPAEVVFAIADWGPGLQDDEFDTVFTPFVTTKPDGLGLGLAICRSVANAHGGRLWAVNNEEGGATFYLVLPGRGS